VFRVHGLGLGLELRLGFARSEQARGTQELGL